MSISLHVSGSRIQNELTTAMAPSLPIFRRQLKTYLFQKSDPDILIRHLMLTPAVILVVTLVT